MLKKIKKKKKEEEKFGFNAFSGKPEIPPSAQGQFTLKNFCLKKPLGEEDRIPNSTTQLIISCQIFSLSFFPQLLQELHAEIFKVASWY